jgi:hypothetical protein
LPSAHLNRIDETASDSDDSYSSDGSPSRAPKHRASPSLPYGPFTGPLPAANAYQSKQRSFRLDRASLLRFLQSNIRRLKPVDLGYGLIFFSCFCVFAAALTGIGYRPESLSIQQLQEQLDVAPRAYAPELAKEEPEQQEWTLVPDAELQQKVAPVAIYGDDIKPIVPLARRVEPLKAQRGQDIALVITDEGDSADEEIPNWAKPKAARQPPTPVPAPAALRQPSLEENEAYQAHEPSEEGGQYVDTTNDEPAEAGDDDATHESVEAEIRRVQEEQQAWEAQQSLNIDERGYTSADSDAQQEYGIDADGMVYPLDSSPETVHIRDSPADQALDDAHAGHYHHEDGANIFVKAPATPDDHAAHDHLSNSVEDEADQITETEDDVVDSEAQEEDTNQPYEIVLRDDGQYVVKLADGSEVSLENLQTINDGEYVHDPEQDSDPDAEEVVVDEEEPEEYKPCVRTFFV